MKFHTQNRFLRIAGIILVVALFVTFSSKRFTNASTWFGIPQSTIIEDLNTEGIDPTQPSSTATVTGFVVAPPSFDDGVLGQKQYSVEVPANATMLQVRVFGNQDINLFARIGQPVTGSGTTFVADYHAPNNLTGDQTITITPNDTNQTPLKAGTIIFGVVNDGGGALNFTLTATLTTSGASGGTNVIPINSGTTISDNIPASTNGVGVLDTNQYSIVVPAGATQLVVSTTSTQNVDLYVRLNQVITQSGNSFQADFSSTSSSGNETIVISSFTSPALQAGTYFIGVVNNANATAQFTLTATITGGNQGTVTALQSGVAQTGTVASPPAGSAFLLNPTQFSIQVPANATQLQVTLTSNNPLDLYVRTGQQVAVGTTNFVFDFASTGSSLTKTITITPGSSPPLQAATYFIGLVNNGPNSANFTLTATVTTGNPQNCTFTISPQNQTFGPAGGTGSVSVTTTSGCAWTATSNSSFVTITSGSGGNGSGTVNFSVAPSTSSFTLFGTLTIAGQTFVVTETAAQQQNCTFTISPTSQNFALAGGSGTVTVTTQTNCSWTAVSNSSFVTVTSGANGTGNGTVNFTVGGTTSARVGTITIAGQTFTVNQNGACSFQISPTSIVATQNVTTSGITVITQAGCQWTAVSNSSFVSITNGSSGTGNGTVSYFLQANTGFTRFGSITVAGLTFNITQTGPLGSPSCPAAATVTSISPSSGAVGTVVDIKGVNFTGITAVKFGNTSASFTVNSDTDLIATVPSGATSGQITLSKNNCGDVQIGAFTVLNCTSTIAVSLPTNVTATAGNNVTIPLTVADLTNKGVLSYDFTITFDPTQLTPQASPITQSGTLSNGMVLAVNTNTPGQIRVSGAATSALSGAGTLLNLNFTVIAQTTACATLNISNFTFNEGSPCATTTNGSLCRGSASISGQVNYAITPQGVTGVTLTAAGTPSATFTTGHNGEYQFTALGTGAYTVTPSKVGDINGAIDAFDASLVLRAAAGLMTLTSSQQIAADVSGDGNVTAFDAALIAQFAVGIPNTSNAGKWVFVPPSISYPSLVTDQINQNYNAILIGDVSGNWTTAIPVSQPGGPVQSRANVKSSVTTATTITASLPIATGSSSANVIFPITVNDLTGSGIFSYEFDISYDPNVLTPLSSPVTEAGTLSSNFQVVPNIPTPGHLLVAAFGTQPLAGSGTLLNLAFKVSAVSSGTSPLTWQTLKFNEGTPQSSTVSGGFTIGDPCGVGISPAVGSFGVAGGSGSINISIANGCPLTPTTSAGWITLGSMSNGALSYTVAANNTSAVRSGTISLGGKTFNVVQGVNAQAVLYGDINHDGRVDVSDLLLLANFIAGNASIDTTAADVMLDGRVDVTDLITLANFIAGNIQGLPQLPAVSQQLKSNDNIAGFAQPMSFTDWKLEAIGKPRDSFGANR